MRVGCDTLSSTHLGDTLFAAADFPESFRHGVRARGLAVGPGRSPRSVRDRAKDEVTLQELRDVLSGPRPG